MEIRSNLSQIKICLQKVLGPTSNPPYISTDEIDINDRLIKQALSLVEQTINCLDNEDTVSATNITDL